MSAGEMQLETDASGDVFASYVTNQSTGYCPEVRSWTAVEQALDQAGIDHFGRFDLECEFRRCQCGQINIVKDDLYECGVCGSELPPVWNMDAQSHPDPAK